MTTGAGGGEAVVGVFDRERLSSALVATHRAGFGPHARVLDPSRGDPAAQLRRAGFPPPFTAGDLGPTASLILVTAPGRAAAASDALARAGARAVHTLRRGQEPAPAAVLVPPAYAPAAEETGA